jgi:cellulose biosynthesis protein BcsQ
MLNFTKEMEKIMSNIKLLILDDDNDYSNNLSTFLTHNYSQIFIVSQLNNNLSDLENCIKQSNADIILTTESYYYRIKKVFNKIIIILSTGMDSLNCSNCPSIFKFTDANKIAAELTAVYANEGHILLNKNSRKGMVVCVYSAAGNIGKTTISLGISSLCAGLGLSVFYLNLERCQSTGLILEDNNEYSFSDIIYYAKCSDGNFNSKVFSMTSFDNNYNIHYFKSPNNSFEMEELTPDNIKTIISCLKESGQYDLIIVDMDSQFNSNAVEAFNISDEILYIINDTEICLHKTKLFLNDLNLFSQGSNTFLAHKIFYVANKVYSRQALLSETSFLNDYNPAGIKILSYLPLIVNNNTISMLIKINGGPEIMNSGLREISLRYMVQGRSTY